jgi:ABC-type transport system involved in multi-copper enzyme maturation permease subunit
MTFLPIVQRELRVAARRRSTFRIRWWTALIALAMSFVSLSFVQLSRSRVAAGSSVFGMLTLYVFGLCLLSGVLMTADALSEEKRSGTLGLLFLTDLKGYDVVLGKFVAHWLNAFYCLLALLPALALPLLLGGVTVGEFWRMVLALISVLFFSLAVGMLISALGREARKTTGNTFWLLLLLSVALPALAFFGGRVSPSWVWSYLTWLSPFSVFANAAEVRYARHPQTFWVGFLMLGGLAALFLALASFIVPRVWQEAKGKSTALFPTKIRRVSGEANAARKKQVRTALLIRNPVLWLASDQMGTQWGAWIFVGLWGMVVCVAMLMEPGGGTVPFLGSYAAVPFGFCLKLLFALQAGRLFSDQRRSGALELLLSTPLSGREIVRGQMLALGRNFFWPFVTFIALLFAPLIVQLVLSIVATDWQQVVVTFSGGLVSVLYAVRFGLDVVALSYFGNGLALTLRRPQLTPSFTILFVLILPSILSPCLLDMVADIVFIVWGASKTNQDLRRLLNSVYQPVYVTPPGVVAGASAVRSM